MPKNKTDPAARTNGQIEEEVTLTAVVRKTEKVCTYIARCTTYMLRDIHHFYVYCMGVCVCKCHILSRYYVHCT